MSARHRSIPRAAWLSLAFLLAASCVLAASPTRASAVEPYAASFSGQCCFETIESGATAKQFFTLTNVGTETWGAPGTFSINLGTDVPKERISAFIAPDWPTSTRPVMGVDHLVPPGAAYKFIFDVKAPIVTVPTRFDESFALVAETYRWLDDETALGPLLSLEYNVLPATPPTIALSLSRSSVNAGESFTVEASANAVASLNHIDVQFAGQDVSSGPPRNPEIAADAKPSWTNTATFNASGASAGPQTVVATAYDDAGLSTTATATINVQSVGPPPIPREPTPTAVVGSPRMYYAGTTIPGNRHRLRLKRVVVLGTTRGERISASCHHCKGKAKLGPVLAKGGQVTLTPRNLVITGRSKIVIYATRPGAEGRYKVYAINVRNVTATPKQQGCLAPGTTTHVACPG